MTPLEANVEEYLLWMRIHNYAETTISCRRRYLAYFSGFCQQHGIGEAGSVTFDLLQSYQRQLFEHRKRDGRSLTVATQVQRLVPVCHFF
jgi:integrase/recombinase XerD